MSIQFTFFFRRSKVERNKVGPAVNFQLMIQAQTSQRDIRYRNHHICSFGGFIKIQLQIVGTVLKFPKQLNLNSEHSNTDKSIINTTQNKKRKK